MSYLRHQGPNGTIAPIPMLWVTVVLFGASVFGVGVKISYYALTKPQFPIFFDIADGILIIIAGIVFFAKGFLEVWKWCQK